MLTSSSPFPYINPIERRICIDSCSIVEMSSYGIRYTSVKMTIQTMSTKCQYRPMTSTLIASSLGHTTAHGHHHQREQHDDTEGNVETVETGEREECATEHVGRQPKTLMLELGELEILTTNED